MEMDSWVKVFSERQRSCAAEIHCPYHCETMFGELKTR